VTSTPQNAARIFTTRGTLSPLSNYQPDGTITLVLPKSIISNPGPGDAIVSILGSVRLGTPSGGTNETIPDSTGAGAYTLRELNLCLPNTAPIARLTADHEDGTQPLTVHFDGSASSDADSIDQVVDYIFNFGDGSDDVDNGNNPMITRTFTEPGEYIVRLVVKDSRGKISSNTAAFIVEVESPVTGVVSRRMHGTISTPFDIDLPLGGTAGEECRLPGPGGTYQLIYTFQRNITQHGTATLVKGTANIDSVVSGPAANEVTVNLSGVTDRQHLVLRLDGAQDTEGTILNNLPARMDVLVGDVNGSGRTDNGDAIAIRNLAGAVPNNTATSRADVNCSGRVDNGDATAVHNNAGAVIP
jgi:PKD repeat protein